MVRGLLSVWRATGEQEFLDLAVGLGISWHAISPQAAISTRSSPCPPERPCRATRPLVAIARLLPIEIRHGMVGSCEATEDTRFIEPYERVLEASLRTCGDFLPGHPERPKVMDRLHAFLYFLEGLLPRARRPVLRRRASGGHRRVAGAAARIAPEFERSDVYAQLLRDAHIRRRAWESRRSISPPPAKRPKRLPRSRPERRPADRWRLSISDGSAGNGCLCQPGLHGVLPAGNGTLGESVVSSRSSTC